jgi:hypothetical protein
VYLQSWSFLLALLALLMATAPHSAHRASDWASAPNAVHPLPSLFCQDEHSYQGARAAGWLLVGLAAGESF